MKNYQWKKNYNEFVEYLKSIGNKESIEQQRRVTNTNYEILGIKIPVLRNIAKEISKGDLYSFLDNVEHNYFEEVMIEGFVIGYIKEEDKLFEYFDKYIDKIDSWALCDSCITSIKLFKKNDYYQYACKLIKSNKEFRIRVGYVIILCHYINDEHIDDILSKVDIVSDYYYVNMAVSWLIAECFIKYRSKTLELLKEMKLSPIIQNKAISKINDSFKVLKEDKLLVKKYKK